MMVTKTRFLVLSARLVFSILLLLSGYTAFAQCAETAEITSNTKCARLTWNIPPGSFPNSIIINSGNYSLVESTPTVGTYTNDGSPNANGCNNWGVYSGNITVGTTICTYADGGLVGSQSLPVEFIDFTAELKNKKAYLSWSTASELNNSGFEIQKSLDGLRWENIDWINGNGSTDELNEYQFIDDQIIAGHNYYRLKQLDFNGAFEFSKIVSVYLIDERVIGFKISPNPAKEFISVNINDEENAYELVIYNQLGQEVKKIQNNFSDHINISGLKNGVYYLVLFMGRNSYSKKLVIN